MKPATSITWRLPTNRRFKVILTEDGAELHVIGGGGERFVLEQFEVIELIGLLTDALEFRQSDAQVVPSAPTREELDRMNRTGQARYVAKVVAKALDSEGSEVEF